MRARIARCLESIWYRGNPLGAVLIPLSWVYRILLGLKRRRGRARRRRFPVPVIVVGNVTVGGTGKTPFVIWLVEQLRARGHSPGIVTRGYLGAQTVEPQSVSQSSSPLEVGDEAVLLAQRTRCPVAACRDRVAAVGHLLRDSVVDVVVSDDGLQHFELQADCSVVIVDGQRGLGNGRLLPAGPLREPAARLDTADLVLVNGQGWKRPQALRFELRTLSVRQLSDGTQRTLEDFAGRSVHAFAAIGNPQRFFEMLRRAGCHVDEHPRADHAVIPIEDLRIDDADPVLITEKDAVKCGPDVPPGVWSVVVGVGISPGDAAQIMETVSGRIGSAADNR